MNMVEDSSGSMLATIAGFISPIFIPLGFGDYRVTTSLISGIMAKESVVSSLTVLFGSIEAINSFFNPFQGFTLLIFTLLYTPCIAAISSIRRELGKKWSIGIAVFQFMVAWVFAGLFSLIFHIIGVM